MRQMVESQLENMINNLPLQLRMPVRTALYPLRMSANFATNMLANGLSMSGYRSLDEEDESMTKALPRQGIFPTSGYQTLMSGFGPSYGQNGLGMSSFAPGQNPWMGNNLPSTPNMQMNQYQSQQLMSDGMRYQRLRHVMSMLLQRYPQMTGYYQSLMASQGLNSMPGHTGLNSMSGMNTMLGLNSIRPYQTDIIQSSNGLTGTSHPASATGQLTGTLSVDGGPLTSALSNLGQSTTPGVSSISSGIRNVVNSLTAPDGMMRTFAEEIIHRNRQKPNSTSIDSGSSASSPSTPSSPGSSSPESSSPESSTSPSPVSSLNPNANQ